MINEDDIDSFVLELYTICQTTPVMFLDEDEGFAWFKEVVHERFDKYWPSLIKERNYN